MLCGYVWWLEPVGHYQTDLSEANHLYKLACDLLQCISITVNGHLLRAHVFLRRGVALCGLCDFKSALLYLEKALNITWENYGAQHSLVALSYDNMGIVFRYMGQHNQAKELHEKALNINIKLKGEEHGDVTASYVNLGNVCA